jgi:hypothetical protein
MLYVIAAILLILWLFGMVTTYTVGGLLQVLLVTFILVALLRVIGRRRAAVR